MPKLKLKQFNDELDKELGKQDENLLEEEIAKSNAEKWQERGLVQVLGLAVEKYLTGGGYSDYSSEREDVLAERYKLVVKDLQTKEKYVIQLSESYGCCYSGYESASYGHIKIEKLEKNFPFSHIPTDPIIIKGFSIIEDGDEISWKQSTIYQLDKNGNIERDDCGNLLTEAHTNEDYDDLDNDGISISNNVFSYSDVGGDIYYPSGGVSLNKELFTPLARAMENRPVWIIEGASGTGKSTLASHLQGLTVFETDSVNELPDVIKADVIVLGNRSGFTRNDVTSRIFGQPNVEIIAVSFQKHVEQQRDYLQEKMDVLENAVNAESCRKRCEAFDASLNELIKSDNISGKKLREYRIKFDAEYEAAGENLKIGKTGGRNRKEIAEIQSGEAKKRMRNQRIIRAMIKSQNDRKHSK